MSQKKIALVADWITHWGGAERVFAKLMEMYPEADIYTSVFFPTRPEVFQGRKIHTSFIQYLPFLNRRHKLCMLLRPLAFWGFSFRKYDIVISSSSAEAKGIHTRGKTKHICYCHTPTRYLWSHSDAYRNFLEFGPLNWLAKFTIPTAFRIMRKWDYKAAQRPDIFIANSCTTQARIAEFYERESIIVYPFFNSSDEGRMTNEEGRKYFVCLGRIVPYKRFDLAIEACNQLGHKLRIFTNTRNSESERLQKLSGPTIEWIFGASDDEVAEGLTNAQAFIMPQEEDFGIVALEAMSHGTPVIAFGDGGAMETVVHGQTGLFFSEQRTESLVNALIKFQEIEWNSERIIEQSQLFSEERFEEGIRDIIGF
ncbi:glycosyltransferase [Candidatus Gracilibacteria bacterium]|nr:glycosyltransferase [Candidatus Gracilibacteria bacterium]